ncbi:MAG: signal peptidase I [Pseudomonadota bacterium]
MTATEDKVLKPTRRVRPWIAALLTFLGWGVGLYYAGKTTLAWRLAIASTIFAAFIIIFALGYLYLFGPTQNSLFKANDSLLRDIVSLSVTLIVMIGVWHYVSQQTVIVERGSRTRLVGYFAVWFLPILASVVFAFAIRVAVFQPFDIPAGSMHPAVQRGDFLVATKWSYGYSHFSAAPFQRLLPQGRILRSTPERGDVVIFKNSKDGYSDYIKRVIGLPGDEIRMMNGRLHINSQPIQKEFISMVTVKCDGRMAEIPSYRETLENGASYIIQECHGDNGRLDNVGPYWVPDGHLFMLGDNRDQSQDSRVIGMMGYVPQENLIGKVRLSD